MPPLPTRIPSLDGLRAISIALVVFGHMAGTQGFPISYEGADYLRLGSLGVRMFFVISGFLITGLLLRELATSGRIDLARFYVRRSLRIFPAYYAFLAIVFLAGMGGLLQFQPGDFLHALTYTSNYHPARSWNLGHTWSLAVEEQFYLLWPAILVLFGRRHGLWLAAGLVAVAPLIRFSAWTLMPHVHWGHRFEMVADSIAVGCVLAALDHWLREQRWYQRLLQSPLFVVVPVIVLAICAFQRRPRLIGLLSPVANVGIALCIHRSVLRPADHIGRILNSGPLVGIGVLSYSLYLWQQIFLNRSSSSSACEFPLNLALTVAASLLSYYLIERPALRSRERIEAWLFSPRAAEPTGERSSLDVYCAVQPPSITSSLPVTNDDSSEARYSTA